MVSALLLIFTRGMDVSVVCVWYPLEKCGRLATLTSIPLPQKGGEVAWPPAILLLSSGGVWSWAIVTLILFA